LSAGQIRATVIGLGGNRNGKGYSGAAVATFSNPPTQAEAHRCWPGSMHWSALGSIKILSEAS